MEYQKALTFEKGRKKTKPGAITAAVSAIVYAIVRQKLQPHFPFTPDIDAAVSVGVAGAIGGIFHGVQEAFYNWQKYHKQKNY